MAGLNDLLESIIGMSATLGGKAVEQAGRHGVMSVARKMNWASKKEKKGFFSNHSISNSKVVSQGPLGDYDITSTYKASLLGGKSTYKKMISEQTNSYKLFGRSFTGNDTYFDVNHNKFSDRKVGSSRHVKNPAGLLGKTKL